MSQDKEPRNNISNPHKVLIMFGSDSDKPIYDKIIKSLQKSSIPFTLKIASTHRTPEFVGKLLEDEDYSIVISGAGLAAALPGSIASKTTKAVIGVPCKGNYEGLDALLSVIQLPPGIPVIATGINNGELAAVTAIRMFTQLTYVNIIGDSNLKSVKKCEDVLVQFDQEFKFSDEVDGAAINVKFSNLGDQTKDEDAIVINVALSEDSTAVAALNLMKMTEHGLWVGLNRGENAALAAMQLINLDGRHDDNFTRYREELKKKVHEANK